MPPLALVREAFRFYRMKSQTLVRVLFLCAYALCILRSVFPRDQENIDALLDSFLTNPYTVLGLAGSGEAIAISRANVIWGVVQIGVSLFLLLFALAYASSYVAEHEGETVGSGLVKFLRSTPRLFAFFFMFFGISFLSSALANPILMLFFLIAGVLTMYFLPLMLSRTKMKLMWAVNRSFVHTRGRRFYIFNCLLLLTFIVNIVSSILQMFLPPDIWVVGLLGGFFVASLTLMHGRLMGELYFVIVKQRESLPGVEKKKTDSDNE